MRNLKTKVLLITGAVLLSASTVFANSDMNMSQMAEMKKMHQSMKMMDVATCEKVMSKMSSQKNSWVPPKNILAELYPKGEEN